MPRSSSRGLPSLLPVLGYLRPYKLRVAGASLALLFTAAATLSLGRGCSRYSQIRRFVYDEICGLRSRVTRIWGSSTIA